MTIPNIIHQIQLENNVDSYMETWYDKFITDNPEYIYILWDNNKLNKLLQESSEIYNFYIKEEKIGKEFISKFYILFNYGGIYIDTESEWENNNIINNTNWDNIITNDESSDFLYIKNPNDNLHNGIIVSSKKNKIIKSKLEEIITNSKLFKELRIFKYEWNLVDKYILNRKFDATNYVPKIIHQLWIGDRSPPIELMNTWKDKHINKGFEYIYWNEEEFIKRGFKSSLNTRINSIEEINGKADILRWEILYKYGGVFIDADSYCIEDISSLVNNSYGFISYENEQIRGSNWSDKYPDVLSYKYPLLSTGTMAFPAKHSLPEFAIKWIKYNEISQNKTGKEAWRTVGPGLLTKLYWCLGFQSKIDLYPSYYFLPSHFQRVTYDGHGKVYADQIWDSTTNYINLYNYKLPNKFLIPSEQISIIIISYNVNDSIVNNCLTSLLEQTGHIFIEIIWVDDFSDIECKKNHEKIIHEFSNKMRFIKIKYIENIYKKGYIKTIDETIPLCSHELIYVSNCDDVMATNRIQLQYEFMESNPNINCCCGQIELINHKFQSIDLPKYNNISLEEFKLNKNLWNIYLPNICFRKSKYLEIINSNDDTEFIEESDILIKMLIYYKIIILLNKTITWVKIKENSNDEYYDYKTNFLNNRIKIINKFII